MYKRIQELEHKLRRLGISAHASLGLEAEIALLRATWTAMPIVDRLQILEHSKCYVPLKDGCVDGRLCRLTAQYWKVDDCLLDAATLQDVTPYGRLVL